MVSRFESIRSRSQSTFDESNSCEEGRRDGFSYALLFQRRNWSQIERGALTTLATYETQVESSEYQNDAGIHHQPFPEAMSEDCDVYADYDGNHCRHVKNNS